MTAAERARFALCVRQSVSPDGPAEESGIGVYREKRLHRVLKYFIESESENHEIRICGSIADILNENGIIEIQTGNFSPLKPKLEKYLNESGLPVTVVFPVAKIKRLAWISPESGEVSKKRRSPKEGGVYDVMRELYKIRAFVGRPGFRLEVYLLEIEEYKMLDGWSRDKKRGASRVERVPVDIFGITRLESRADYAALLPGGDFDTRAFTVAELVRALKITRSCAYAFISVLRAAGVVDLKGKTGRVNLYGAKPLENVK